MMNSIKDIELNEKELLASEEAIFSDFDEDSSAVEENESDLDFYTHESLDALLIMQDEFKREQI